MASHITPKAASGCEAKRGATQSEAAVAKPIPVLILISNLGYGGAERQVVEIFNHIDRKKIDLHLCTLSSHLPNAPSLIDLPKRLHNIQKKHKYDFSVVGRVYKLIKLYRIEIVHGFLFDAEITARLAGKLAGCPLVISSERNSFHNYRSIQTVLFKITASMANLCIANSEAGIKYHKSTFNLPPEKYRLLRNGVDLERFNKQPTEHIRQSLELDDDTLVVGMFGSLKRQKNHRLLIESIPSIVEDIPKVKFLFVGGHLEEGHESGASGAGYKQELITLIEQLNIEKFCLFVGAKSDIEAWYSLCDLTVLPSLYEGTPNVLLESLACGTPVIATDVADNKTLLPDHCGATVPLNDPSYLAEKVSQLLGNPEKREAFSKNARQHAEKEFSLQKMAKTLEDIYLSSRQDQLAR